MLCSDHVPWTSALSHLECARCGERYDADQQHNLCRCGSPPPDKARTVAFGINVAAALGDFLILSALRDTKGTAVAAGDEEILAEQAACAASDGVLMCPEGASTLAAVRRLRNDGWLSGDEEVLVLNTGNVLKYTDVLMAADPPELARDATRPAETTAPAAAPGTAADSAGAGR